MKKAFLFGLLLGSPGGIIAYFYGFWISIALFIFVVVWFLFGYFLGIDQVRDWKRQNSKYWKDFLDEP